MPVVIITLAIGVAYLALKLEQSPRKQLPYSQTFGYGGKTMNYQVQGEGKPVILVHGAMSHDPWNNYGAELAQHAKVYQLDLPGYGGSDSLPGEVHDTELFAGALCEFVKKEQIEDATVISLSMGTIVSAKAARAGCLKGTLIMAGVPAVRESWQSRWAQALPRELRRVIASTNIGKAKLLVPLVNENTGSPTNDLNGDVNRLGQYAPEALVDPNYLDEFSQVPELIKQVENEMVYIYGERDPYRGKVELPKEYLTIPGAGHNIFESPNESVNEAIVPLLTLST